MNIDDLKKIVYKNLENKSQEVLRLFHGRGNFYENYSFLTIDSIDDILYICFFSQTNEEKELLEFFEELYEKGSFKTLVLQRRYLDKQPCEILKGELKEELFAIENNLKYKISFSNRNLGLFFDMKNGREFVLNNSKDKNVLNLFSYTCAFSICASSVGASKVVNVDMAKGALTIGRENHHLNNLTTKNIKFMPYNILKSWSRIKKEGPYDLIIIDPPSFQKGSFAASSDYLKIVKRLKQLASEKCTILSCLNAPELDTKFIKGIFTEYANEFKYIKRVDNLDTFPSNNDEKSLKNLIFRNYDE